MKAMLLAAGFGTRLKPWTDVHPKALAIINNKSLLQRNIEYLQSFGIRDVIVNVHHFSDQIIDAIELNKGWGSKVIISDEREQVLETGGGLLKARNYFDKGEDFLLMNVDILIDLPLKSIIDKHKQRKDLATLAVSKRSSSRRLLFDENKFLCGWENIQTGEQKFARLSLDLKSMAFSGLHIINHRIFDLITEQGKFSMIDVYLRLAKKEIIGFYDHTGSKFIDVGKPESISIAESLFN